MQKLISQIPELSAYLARVPKVDHISALKHIVKVGLQSLQSHCCKQNQPRPNNLVNEIDRIKENLIELNQMVKHQCHHCCACINPTNERRVLEQQRETQGNYRQYQIDDNSANTFSFQPPRDNGPYFDPPVRETSANYVPTKQKQEKAVNPFSKTKAVVSRHHLDDTEARSALTFPPQILAQVHHPSKRRSQEFKKHIYQEQINKEEQVKLKEDRDQNDEDNRATRSVSDHRKATSKIKSLLDKDRIRYQQRQRERSFRQGFNKYEYSDENQMEESSISQQPEREQVHVEKSNRPSYEQNTYNQHYHSSFKASNPASSSQKPSSKKQFERSKKEVSSKLQVSQGEQLQKLEQHSKNSSQGGIIQYRPSERASDNYNRDDEEEDVVSNSSSFSQFSISGSQKRDVGKISRKSNS